MIATESALIDALGGNAALADQFQVKPNTVSGWRARGFPPWTHAELRKAVASKLIAVDPALFKIKRPRPLRAA